MLDDIPNNEIRRRIEVEKMFVDTGETKQLVWYGHTMRMNHKRLPKVVYNWVSHRRGLRIRKGRPRKRWKEKIRNAMKRRNVTK